MPKLAARIIAVLERNPLAWLLAAALVICEWGNYDTGRDLRELCELTGPHVGTMPERYAITPQYKIDNICGRHEPE